MPKAAPDIMGISSSLRWELEQKILDRHMTKTHLIFTVYQLRSLTSYSLRRKPDKPKSEGERENERKRDRTGAKLS